MASFAISPTVFFRRDGMEQTHWLAKLRHPVSQDFKVTCFLYHKISRKPQFSISSFGWLNFCLNRYRYLISNMERLPNLHLLAIAYFLVCRAIQVSGFSYLDSLSTPQSELPVVATKNTGDYFDYLQNQSATDATIDCANTIEETPDDHYAKDHPGAGWAGYKDHMYGGYLDHLSSSDANQECVFEVGKKADYGDDIRWGAQVYLDNLK